jgi:ketosteroid isomerase-like protein
MTKFVGLCFFLLSNIFSFSQKNIDGLIVAEKNFAAYSVANSTKEAFLKFADSTGISFDNGSPVNAIEIWNKREKRPGKLNWFPEYAEIAASGDFGYTTGLWEFSTNDTAKGSGYYITVWHTNKDREWKFLLDLGVGDAVCDMFAVEKNIIESDPLNRGSEASLMQREEQFIAGYQQNGKATYTNFISPESRLYRNRRCVADDPGKRYWAFDSLPSKIQYMINGSGIASSGDLGYVYGTTIVNGKTDNYQRIWRREKGEWKIAVEVLRY